MNLRGEYMYYLKSRLLLLDKIKAYFTHDKDVFDVFGVDVFCGEMGSGKTISMIDWVYHLMKTYKKCLLVTNLDVSFPGVSFDRVIPYVSFQDFYHYHNDDFGIIYMIDEMQIEANNIDKLSSSDSKALNTFFTQLRSKHIYVVGSTPNFSRLSKLVRENFKTLVVCHNKGLKQTNKYFCRHSQEDKFVVDGNLNLELFDEYSFYHTRFLYGLFNTFECQGGI